MICDLRRAIFGCMRRSPLKTVLWLVAIGAAVLGLTVFGGWSAFMDASGISEVTNNPQVYRALDSQCGQIEQAYPDDTVGCATAVEFQQDLRMACADVGSVAVDHFVVTRPGTTQIVPMTCR
ncbi:MAG: hypothetical protein ACHQJ5_00375 [Vicinamibacteria bacterium]